jgi:hypothetical protein
VCSNALSHDGVLFANVSDRDGVAWPCTLVHRRSFNTVKLFVGQSKSFQLPLCDAPNSGMHALGGTNIECSARLRCMLTLAELQSTGGASLKSANSIHSYSFRPTETLLASLLSRYAAIDQFWCMHKPWSISQQFENLVLLCAAPRRNHYRDEWHARLLFEGLLLVRTLAAVVSSSNALVHIAVNDFLNSISKTPRLLGPWLSASFDAVC